MSSLDVEGPDESPIRPDIPCEPRPCAARLAADEDDRPIAKRHYPGTEPWKVTIPFEDPDKGNVLPGVAITLELSTIKWLYK